MPLNIKDAETDRLARELAALTGESITVATRHALEERLRAVRRRSRPSSNLNEIISRGRQRATHSDATAEEILGYDEHGLPT